MSSMFKASRSLALVQACLWCELVNGISIPQRGFEMNLLAPKSTDHVPLCEALKALDATAVHEALTKVRANERAPDVLFESLFCAHGFYDSSQTKWGFSYPAQLRSYKNRLKAIPYLKTVCEIGVNTATSAANLMLDNDAKYIGFDLGASKYVNKSAAYLDLLFPGRATIIFGPSSRTIPKLAEDQSPPTCDFIHVDGGHTYEQALDDIRNSYALADCHSTVLAIDDLMFRSVYRAWEETKGANLTLETYDSGKTVQQWTTSGFTVAYDPKHWVFGRYTCPAV